MMETTSGTRRECKSPEELPAIAEWILHEAGQHRVFAFYGQMGAGKTTLIKELCRALGVSDMVVSPTFTILNEYQAGNGDPIYHFDFYRIKSESEAYDLGYENYLYSGNYCFIEWPEKIAALLPENFAAVRMEVSSAGREITLNV